MIDQKRPKSYLSIVRFNRIAKGPKRQFSF